MKSNLHRLTNETVYIAETYRQDPSTLYFYCPDRNGTLKLKQKVLLSPNQTRVEQVARVLLPFIGRTQSGTSTTSTLQEGLCFVACSLLFACLVAKDRPPKFEWQPGGSCWNACLYFHFQYGDFKSYTWVYNLDNTCEWDQASCSVSPITATHDFNCGTFIGIVW